jgi:hypothetical protein
MELIQQSFIFSSFPSLALLSSISCLSFLISIFAAYIYTSLAPLLISAPEAKQNGKQLLVIST